jgi:hypothetical protein
MRKSILSVLIITFFFTVPIYADIYMVNKTHTDGMAVMGQEQPAQDEIQKVWITKNKIKSTTGDKAVFMLLDESKMIILNHEDKTYIEMPMGAGNMMDKAMEGKSSEEKKEMEGFMQMAKGMMKFEIIVTPTSETKKINKWDCKKYKQEVKMGMGPIVSEVWATEELEMDYELFAKFSTAMMAMQPGFSDSFDKAMNELKKIKGIPVFTKTTMNMMGMQMNSTQELIEFKKGVAPKGTFDIPKGYKKSDSPFGH